MQSERSTEYAEASKWIPIDNRVGQHQSYLAKKRIKKVSSTGIFNWKKDNCRERQEEDKGQRQT